MQYFKKWGVAFNDGMFSIWRKQQFLAIKATLQMLSKETMVYATQVASLQS